MVASDVSSHAAKAYLNDATQAFWTNAVLLPCVTAAVLQLEELLLVNSIDVDRKVSVTIDVDAGDTELDEYPTDFVSPIQLRERTSGSSETWSEPIDEVKDIDPNNTLSAIINEWAFNSNKVYINPPTGHREVRLLYNATLTPVTATSSTIDISTSLNYLARATAALAMLTIGNNPTKAAEMGPLVARAEVNLITRLLNDDQGNGVRRRAYKGATRR